MPKKLHVVFTFVMVVSLSLLASHPGLADTRQTKDPLREKLIAKSSNACTKCCCGTQEKQCTHACRAMGSSTTQLVHATETCKEELPKSKAHQKKVCGPLSNASIAVNELCSRACFMKAAIEANHIQILDDQE